MKTFIWLKRTSTLQQIDVKLLELGSKFLSWIEKVEILLFYKSEFFYRVFSLLNLLCATNSDSMMSYGCPIFLHK